MSHRLSPNRAGARALVSLAALLGLLAVALTLSRGSQERGPSGGLADVRLAPATQPPHSLRYLRSGQWWADARTVFEVLRYLLQREPDGPPGTRFRSVAVAMPTNSTAIVPKV